MGWTSGNRYLNLEEMKGNALEVNNILGSNGFTLNAVSAILGNMARESNVNPGIWQNLKVNYKLGYGLVQWTPASNVINWLKQNGYSIDSGEGQCNRILWEKRNGFQYYETRPYPLSFNQFSLSTQDVEYLTRAFFANYERGNPAKADMEGRIEWAKYFYEYLQDKEPQPP